MAQSLSFLKVYLGQGPSDYELVGGPQEAVDLFERAIHTLPDITYSHIDRDEAFIELYSTGVGAGCFLEHSYDVIENESRRAKASSILLSLVKRLGCGSIYEPAAIGNGKPGIYYR